MTVASTTNKATYSGNGTTTVFTVPFYFLAAADLQVILRSGATETVQTLTTQYTVTGAGVPSGGSVTMLTAPPSGTTLTILRNVEATQETDLLPNDRLPAESLETALDKATMLIQQLDEEVGRSLKYPATDAAMSAQLPTSTGRASKFLSFDASGNPEATIGTDATTSTFLQAGAGAVTRSVNDKLREVVSAKDFGVVGDGSTNDTAALSLAIAAAANKTLSIPSGMTIYVTSQIVLSSPISIIMDAGSSIKSGYASPSPDNGLISIASSDVTLTGVVIDGQSNDHAAIKATGVNRLKVIGGNIYSYGQRSAVWMQACNFCDIVGVQIGASIVSSGAGNQGAIYANQCSDILIENVRITGFYGKGISIRLTTRCSISDCFIRGNQTAFGDGVYIGYDSSYVSIIGCHIRDCQGNGIKLSRGAIRNSVIGCTIDGTTVAGNGIMLQGAVESVISGCKVALNDATSATRSLIIQPHDEDAPGEGSDCSGNVISDNVFICYSSTVPAVQLDNNATGFTTYTNKISGNYIYGGQIGVAAYTLRTQVVGNNIIDSATKSISVRYAASHSDVIGNYIVGNASDAAIYVDLDSGGQGLNVSNNRLTNCGYGGIYVANSKRSNFTSNLISGTGVAGSGIDIASSTNDVNVCQNYVYNFPNAGISAASASITGINVSGNQLESCTTNAISIAAATGRAIGNIAKSSGAFSIANDPDLIAYGNSDQRLYVTTPNGTARYAIAVDNSGNVTSTLV